jgi:hypothetical protein
MKLIINLTYSICLIALFGCKMPKEESEVLNYNNILIYTDLSNRLEKVPNDTMLINQLINYFITECVKPGIKVNDRSSIYFSRVNMYNSKCNTARIDIGEQKNLQEKQLYVNNNSKSSTLLSDVDKFKRIVECNYSERDEGGLDILSLLYNEINNGIYIKKPTFILGENDTTYINFTNHLFLFTDGYLEYDTTIGNSDFYFGQPQIEKIRQFCKTNNTLPVEAIKTNPEFKLRPLKAEFNKYINLYILETYDRGLDQQKGTFKYTGDLSDNNILNIIWEAWAKDSGFKSFTWKQMTKPSSAPSDYIKNIIVR